MKIKLLPLLVCIAVLVPAVLVGPAVKPALGAGTLYVPSQYSTIPAAISAAADGDTIVVAAGTYTGQVTITKNVSIIGAGSSQTIITGGNPAVLLAVTGTDTHPILLKDLQIHGINGIQTTVTPISYVTLDHVVIAAATPDTGIGFQVTTGHSLTHLSVVGSVFQDFLYGFAAHKTPGTGDSGTKLQYVTITDTVFRNNKMKGMYVETLSDATFADVQVIGNGVFPGAVELSEKMGAGLDINLKDGAYSNLTFNNLTVTGNGLETPYGAGIMIKARGTGSDSSYSAYPATLTNITFNGGTFTGNERGIRFGEPGKANTGPTNVNIHDAIISGNVQTYTGTDGSAYGGLVNETTATPDVTNNYWGHSSGPNPPGSGDTISGPVVGPSPWSILSIASVNPTQGTQGDTLDDVIISGTTLNAVTLVSFGSGITVNNFTATSSTQIRANITIDLDATPGSRNVSVTTGSGETVSLTSAFLVNEYVTPSHYGTGWYEQFTGFRPSPSLAYVYGQNRVCQTFTPSKDHYFDSVSLWLYRAGWSNYSVTVALHNVVGNQPVEPALCSTSFAASSLTTTATTWRTYTFKTGCELSAGTEYALVISISGGTFSTRVNIRTYATDVYEGGQLGTSTDAGATWHMDSGDMAFKEGQGFWQESQASTTPGLIVSGQNQAYQTFTPSRDHYLNLVMLSFYKAGAPTYTVTIALHTWDDVNNQPVQPALCSTTLLAKALTTKATWRTCVFPSGYPVSADTQYALVISASSVGGSGYVIASANATGGYSGGECGLSTNGGSSWQALAGADLAFQEGESPSYTGFGSSNASAAVYGDDQICQTFTPSKSHYFDYVSLSLYRVGSPTYTVTISLCNVDENHQPAGVLCSTSFAASSLTTPKPSWNTYPWYDFRFPTGAQLSSGTEYALVLSGGGGDAANYVNVRIYNKNLYIGGQRGQYDGSSWQMLPTQDMAFIEGGSNTAAQLGSGWYDQFTGYAPSPSSASVYGQSRVCQTFTASDSYYFNFVSLWLSRMGSQNYTVTISLYATAGNQPVAPALCSTSFAASSLPVWATTWRTYAFAPGCQLSAGTVYALVISANGGNASNRVVVRTYAANGYSSGQLGTSSDAGGTWQMNSGADMSFKTGQSTWRESQISASPAILASGQTQVYQTFTPSRDHYFNYVSLNLCKWGAPNYTVTIALHTVDGNNQPVQPAKCSTTFLASSLPRTAAWRTCLFSPGYEVSAGTRYAIVLSCSGSLGYVMAGATAAGGYSGGECGLSTDAGATWQALPGPDLAFREGEYPWYTALGSSNASASVYGQNRLCQTFTPAKSHYFEYVSLALYRVGNPMYDVTISLYNVDANHQPTGSALCSTTLAASSLTLPPPYRGAYPWYEFRFPTGAQLSAGTEYALVLSGDGGGDAANSVTTRIYTKNYYAGGQRGQYDGSSWQMLPTQDMTFIEGGVA